MTAPEGVPDVAAIRADAARMLNQPLMGDALAYTLRTARETIPALLDALDRERREKAKLRLELSAAGNSLVDMAADALKAEARADAAEKALREVTAKLQAVERMRSYAIKSLDGTIDRVDAALAPKGQEDGK